MRAASFSVSVAFTAFSSLSPVVLGLVDLGITQGLEVGSSDKLLGRNEPRENKLDSNTVDLSHSIYFSPKLFRGFRYDKFSLLARLELFL